MEFTLIGWAEVQKMEEDGVGRVNGLGRASGRLLVVTEAMSQPHAPRLLTSLLTLPNASDRQHRHLR
jgi:hypothetical protein